MREWTQTLQNQPNHNVEKVKTKAKPAAKSKTAAVTKPKATPKRISSKKPVPVKTAPAKPAPPPEAPDVLVANSNSNSKNEASISDEGTVQAACPDGKQGVGSP